jgi:hypothetical protein
VLAEDAKAAFLQREREHQSEKWGQKNVRRKMGFMFLTLFAASMKLPFNLSHAHLIVDQTNLIGSSCCDFVVLGSNIVLLGKSCRSRGRLGCRGDIVIGHFLEGSRPSDQKSRFSGNISHFGVAATLFKIWSRAMMWA